MISRLLPAVNSAASHLPPGIRRTYGDLSNRVLDASVVYRNLRSTVAEMGSALIDFSRPPTTECEQRVDEFASLIRPWTTDGLELQRVGGALDGAYVMAPIGAVEGALSIGVGHDVTWDQAIAARGIPVHMFDPTVAGLPEPVPGGVFHRIGIGPTTGLHDGMELRQLDALVTLAGMTTSRELLLKVDVEGAEWASLCTTDFAPFQQVLLEMHDLSRLKDAAAATEVLRTVRSLAATHLPVHVHANNEGAFNRYDGRWFPDVIEVSYVRRDLLESVRPATSLVVGLDRPSNPKYPDYDLSGLLTVEPMPA
jgi:hypothetical protein